MRVDDFIDPSTGTLVAIPDQVAPFAFEPTPLPPSTWRWPERLWQPLMEAREALGQLRGIGPFLPDPGLLLRPLQNREAITSSKMEGTYATPRQLMLFEADPNSAEGNPDADQWLEVLNYRRALEEGVDLLRTLPVSTRLMKALHKTLLQGVRGAKATPGEFRRGQVGIGRPGSAPRFVPPPPQSVPGHLDDLERYVNQEDHEFDPLVESFLVHYQFETIHPFGDGNGRIGRLLMSLMIYQGCNLGAPWLYLSPYFDAHRSDYIDRLYGVSARGEWEAWIAFCLEGVKVQGNDISERCRRLVHLKEEFHARVKAGGGSLRVISIVDSLLSQPYLTVTEAAKRLEVSYNTAKADLGKLEALGILTELEDSEQKTFVAIDVFDISYGDLGTTP